MKTLYTLHKEAVAKYGNENVFSIANAQTRILKSVFNNHDLRDKTIVTVKGTIEFSEDIEEDIISLMKK